MNGFTNWERFSTTGFQHCSSTLYYFVWVSNQCKFFTNCFFISKTKIQLPVYGVYMRELQKEWKFFSTTQTINGISTISTPSLFALEWLNKNWRNLKSMQKVSIFTNILRIAFWVVGDICWNKVTTCYLQRGEWWKLCGPLIDCANYSFMVVFFIGLWKNYFQCFSRENH